MLKGQWALPGQGETSPFRFFGSMWTSLCEAGASVPSSLMPAIAPPSHHKAMHVIRSAERFRGFRCLITFGIELPLAYRPFQHHQS